MKNVVEFSEKSKIEQEAAEWLIKLDGDSELSKEERAKFKKWLNRNPLHVKQFQELAEMWSEMNVLTELAVPLARPKARIHGILKSWFFPPQLATLVATFVIAVTLGTTYFYMAGSPQRTNGLYVTNIGHQNSTRLSDGSLIQLNTNTRVRVEYNQGFRDVYLLQGEAHFTVAKNKDMPFRVFAGAGRIHAIGTAFSVYLKENEVDVTVSEGRVALSSIASQNTQPVEADGSNGDVAKDSSVRSLGMLRAGQAVTISSQLDEKANRIEVLDNLRSIGNMDIVKRLSWTQGVLVFSGESLEEVVKEISRYTTVSIEFSDPELKTIRIGGRFPVGETEAMFTSLEANFGFKVTRLDNNHVLVSAAN